MENHGEGTGHRHAHRRRPARHRAGRTAPQLHAALQALAFGPDRGLVIDLGRLTFCDSSGITAMLVAQRLTTAAGAPMALAAVPGRVVRTLELAGLDQVFTIHPTAAGATAEDPI